MNNTQKSLVVSEKELRKLQESVSYRNPMQISEIIIYHDSYLGYVGNYICPRCKASLERDFMSFCDRCGQKLSWKNYKKAKRIYPGEETNNPK